MIVVGVDVNKAWCNNPIGGVELHIGLVVCQVSDNGDSITPNSNVCLIAWHTRAIDHFSIPDDKVVS